MKRFAPLVALLCVAGCASVPRSRYGVERIRVEGMRAFSEESLLVCLASREREHVALTLGLDPPGPCGEAPFEDGTIDVPLWTWGFTEWPLFDRVVVERDKERIERWYAARGYHGARVERVEVDPPQAYENDVLDPRDPDPGCDRLDDDEGCAAEIVFHVEEGPMTTLTDVDLHFEGEASSELRAEVERALPATGERFDEANYDASKQGIAAILSSHGYARGIVEGVVRVDRPARTARVDFTVTPGPVCVFGDVHVEGEGELPVHVISAAVQIEPGEPYDPAALDEAQRAIYALGGFSSVLVEADVPEEGNAIDVSVRVNPAPHRQFGFGVGVQSGVMQQAGSFDQVSVPLWDVHLIAKYRNRNFLGGLRQLRLEERPRLISLEPFPSFQTPHFGNIVTAELEQPGFLEARTSLLFDVTSELGPDPYDAFFRHKLQSGVTARRYFSNEQRLFASFALRNDFYSVVSGDTGGDLSCSSVDGGQRCAPRERPTDYVHTYLEQRVRLDLRDRPSRPRLGLFAQLNVAEAGFFLPSDWSSVRVLPELRFYLPLPFKLVIAGRMAVGMLFVSSASEDLTDISQRLGPRDHRLRGGGASSNRGFLPGRLGDGLSGGSRRWEASLELRAPITPDLETALFIDAGDVHDGDTFRLDHPQTSVGIGFRYYTLLIIRVDLAWRVPGLQVLGGNDRRSPGSPDTDVDLFGLTQWPGAVHITIGEPF